MPLALIFVGTHICPRAGLMPECIWPMRPTLWLLVEPQHMLPGQSQQLVPVVAMETVVEEAVAEVADVAEVVDVDKVAA